MTWKRGRRTSRIKEGAKTDEQKGSDESSEAKPVEETKKEGDSSQQPAGNASEAAKG